MPSSAQSVLRSRLPTSHVGYRLPNDPGVEDRRPLPMPMCIDSLSAARRRRRKEDDFSSEEPSPSRPSA